MGTAAVQLVHLAGAIPIVTAGSQKKIDTAKSLGAQDGFNYKDDAGFSDKVFQATAGKYKQDAVGVKSLSTLIQSSSYVAS